MYNKNDNCNTYAVYCHYFPNGKVYVGLTCHADDVDGMRYGHNGSKYSKQPLVYRAIQKYGWENIQHEIIAKYINRESAINIEKDLIELYQSNNREHGYNISPGGEEGSYHSEESRKKMSEQRKGKKKSEEHKKKIGDAYRGMKMSEDFCRKLSEIAKNRHCDTTKDPRNKAVLQYRINDGQLVGRYISVSSAERETGIRKNHISECAKEKRRQAGQCIWVFEDEVDDKHVIERIERAKMHKLYKPVIVSKSNNYIDCEYYQTEKSASEIVGCTLRDIERYIKSQTPINGYYIKRITVEEYLSYISNINSPS